MRSSRMATGIVRRNDDEGEIAGREAAKLVYGADSPYTRQPELATIARSRWTTCRRGTTARMQGKLIVERQRRLRPGGDGGQGCARRLKGCRRSRPCRRGTTRFTRPSRGVYFIDKEDVNQSNVEIVGLGTDRRNPDVPALAVMNDILGGGFGSRLFQKVRTELGLAYAVGGGFGFEYDHPATFEWRCSPRARRRWTRPRRRWRRLPGSTQGRSPKRN